MNKTDAGETSGSKLNKASFEELLRG